MNNLLPPSYTLVMMFAGTVGMSVLTLVIWKISKEREVGLLTFIWLDLGYFLLWYAVFRLAVLLGTSIAVAIERS